MPTVVNLYLFSSIYESDLIKFLNFTGKTVLLIISLNFFVVALTFSQYTFIFLCFVVLNKIEYPLNIKNYI